MEAQQVKESTKKRLMGRLDALKNEATQWRTKWRELADNVKPNSGRFFATDRANAGARKDQEIINNKPTVALRTLAAGMMAGITSPSRPWLRVTTQDPKLAESAAAKEWLATVEGRIRSAFAKSNLYNCLHTAYSMLGLFGVTVLHVDEDAEDVMRGYVAPIGQFYVSASDRGAVDTYFRVFQMTTRQLVKKFGLEACSAEVKKAHAAGQMEEWFEVLHVVEPNEQLDPEKKLSPKSKPFSSWWFETGGDQDAPPLLEAGYDDMPFCGPRWDVTGETVYGDSPAMDALGDCKALQVMENRKAQLIDKLANPPLRGPSSLMNGRGISLLPGATNFVDAVNPHATLQPVFEVNPQAVALVEQSIREHERRIDTGFYADLWLMLSQSDGQMTATEVQERREEKLLQLGPVLERLQDELLDPLVDRVFAILTRAGQIPPPPRELSGVDLDVEYISIMAQAQKLIGTVGVQKALEFILAAAQANPAVLDKLDFDQTVDEYTDMLGTPPAIIRSDEKVQAMRADRAKQAQQQQQLAAAQQVAQTAKTASEADTEGNNALTMMMRGLGAQ